MKLPSSTSSSSPSTTTTTSSSSSYKGKQDKAKNEGCKPLCPRSLQVLDSHNNKRPARAFKTPGFFTFQLFVLRLTISTHSEQL